MNYTIKNSFYTLTASSMGAEAVSIKNAVGRELLWQNPWQEGWQRHAPLLFPFCGRLKDATYYANGKSYPMTIHGFAPTSEFKLIKATDDTLVFQLEASDATRAIYPYDFRLTASYKLLGDEISLSVTVENTGDEELPFMFGWHPGFVLFTDEGQDIEDYAVKFKNRHELTRIIAEDNYDIPPLQVKYPTPKSEYKLCESQIYECDTMVFCDTGTDVTLEADGHPYKLEMSYSENLPVLCIWKMARHEAKYICIEPWSQAVYRGEDSNVMEKRTMTRLAAGKKEDYFYKIRFSFT